MEGHFSTGQNPQWAVVPMDEEEEEEEEEEKKNCRGTTCTTEFCKFLLLSLKYTDAAVTFRKVRPKSNFA